MLKHLLGATGVWLALVSAAAAEVRQVGPGAAYAAPCAAFAAAADGDTIEIDAAGTYSGDVCAIGRSRLTIRGVNGRPRIDAGGKNAGGKAIWVIQGADTVVEDIELSGCTVPDANGAGIRQEGRNLTVRRGFFHDNQNGILGNADSASVYLIEDSEFARNGAGDGQSHNMYIGEIASFTLRGSYSHDARVGHLVKSRALENHILYNRLSDDQGNASYQLDLPQGGPSYVIGNLFQKSARAENSSFVSFAREPKRNPGSALWVVNNTFVNNRSAGTFVSVASDVGEVLLRNNVFWGAGTACDLPSARSDNNLATSSGLDGFALQAGSAAIDKGSAPGLGGGESLLASCQYAEPAHAVQRAQVGSLDQGALEYGNTSTRPCGAGAGEDAGVASARDASSPAAPDAATPGALRDAATLDAAPVGDASVRAPDASEDAGTAVRASSGCQSASTRAQAWLPLTLVLWVSRRRRKLAPRGV